MGCTIDQNLIDKTIEFHGHSCPGLAIGIRLAELAIERLDIANSPSPLCVAETDMCALDAVQFLTGCTYGKGNLVHKDYGKSGFTFFDRSRGKGFRAVFIKKLQQSDQERDRMLSLMEKVMKGKATQEENRSYQDQRAQSIQSIMDAGLNDLFTVEEVVKPPVRPAKVLASIECQACHEMVMESRIRRFAGKDLCIPCFMEQEQKI
ncbi:MAG: formylmethanofuran dehydrogenase [Desulfobacteraceae bacterium]|nr:formylmethanofuran dehydrogenase [Desulfobacteraceae bacterium]